jgi:SAM-dependent methyltransferase
MMFHVEQLAPMICPSCQNKSFKPLMDVGDHFLSKERFKLLQCGLCSLLRTDPMPSETEIGAYYKSDEYLSHGAERKGLFASLYRLAKNHNLSWKTNLISRLHNDARYLDYGCGTADLISHCQSRGMNVRGAEPNSEAISHAPSDVRAAIVSPKEELESIRTYDVISLWHVLEHIHEPREVLLKLKEKINSSGHLVIAIPNYASFDAKHYGAHWAAWDVPRHLWHYTPDQIIPFLESLGFNHIDTKAMWFDAFYVSLLSERYKGRPAFLGIFWASISNLRALFNKKRTCSSQTYIFRLK